MVRTQGEDHLHLEPMPPIIIKEKIIMENGERRKLEQQ